MTTTKELSKYIDSMIDAMTGTVSTLGDVATVYAHMVQAAHRLEREMMTAGDLELQEVKPVVTTEVADAALNLAARATRHYFVEVEYNAADGAGLEDE